MNYGEKIAQLRKKNKMTQKDLGKKLNVTPQCVSKWERGESQPDFDTLNKISKLYQVPISYFQDEADEKEPQSEVAATASAQVVQADIIGMCVQCGKVVREGDEEITHPKLICKACAELIRQEKEKRILAAKREKEAAVQRKKDEVEYAKADLKRRRNWALIIAVIPAVAVFVTFLVTGLTEKDGDFYSYFGPGCILAVLAFTFTSQMIWGKRVEGIIYEICTGGGHIMRLPGVIFSLSPEGFLFLIATKIILFFVAIFVFFASIFICIALAILASPLTFIPSLLFYNLKIHKINENNVDYQ